MALRLLLAAIDDWDAESCILFLEQDGDVAPEYDLETSQGLELLREDCREKARAYFQAA